MATTQLIVRGGYLNYGDEAEFTVLDGGALEIKSEGQVDLIGPGFWVAVSRGDRLDGDILAPQPDID